MKIVHKEVYSSFDGKSFDTAAECRAYEKRYSYLAIVGLTEAQALAIAEREDVERADAVERLGVSIAALRIAAGGRRRRAPERLQETAPEPQPDMNPNQAPALAGELS